MGEAGSGPRSENCIQPLTAPSDGVKASSHKSKAAAERLYGRTRGSRLRPRQVELLSRTLPRLLLGKSQLAEPWSAFDTAIRALWLEVGFGGGEHARAQVAANPDAGLIACEVYENGICSLLSALVPEGAEDLAPLPANLRIWNDDARLILRDLPPGCLDRLFLLFPDPWPKARHTKRRFVHPDNIPLVARALRTGGEWRIASDDPTYQRWTEEVLAAQTLFDVLPPARSRPDAWPPTRYERKAELAGRSALYWSAIRNSRQPEAASMA